MMRILEYIQNNPNWEADLTKAPYCITTKWDGDYFILSYNQFNSDFSNELVRQCRGSIFHFDGTNYTVACMPFYKFGNYGESYADDIDWDSAIVAEKIDGSLIKVWYHLGEWHVSTNGTIDAHSANVGETGYNFYDIFERAVVNIEDFFNHLDTNYWYMFELTSPETMVVIPYDTGIYYLSRRNIITFEEDNEPIDVPEVKNVNTYNLDTLNDCISAAFMLDENHEGFVVRDKYFHRIKVKGPEYLRLAKCRPQNPGALNNVFEPWVNETLDDYISYNKSAENMIRRVADGFNSVWEDMLCGWFKLAGLWNAPKKNFAIAAQSLGTEYCAFYFWCYANKNRDFKDYLKDDKGRSFFLKRVKKGGMLCEEEV